MSEFRVAQRLLALRAYESFTGTDKTERAAKRAADEVMKDGWKLGRHPRVTISSPLDWDVLCFGDRSWSFHLHSWDFLDQILAFHSSSSRSEYLRFAAEVALDWVRSYPDNVHVDGSFAWYDMAVGMRAYRLGYIVDAAARDGAFDNDTIEALLQSVHTHLEELSNDDRFASHSNHGFYQAAGQAALARRFPQLARARDAGAQADARLRQLIDAQFTSEGIHREHSPDYHRMVLQTLSGLIDSGLIQDPVAHQIRRRAEDALAWFVRPDSRLVNFGDTDTRLFGPSFLRRQHVESPALRYVLSSGAEGAPPEERMAVFGRSGYVVMRSGWEFDEKRQVPPSYLAQTAAFHSRTHKHADDLSFIWFDRGEELLVDSGRFGYQGRTPAGSELRDAGFWYSDPRRIYVESTRAHNTVEIDGRSHARRGVKPYGSAIEEAGESEGLLYSTTHVRHGSIRHARTLVWEPHRWLLVVDWLWDNLRRPHDLIQWFHFAPEVEVTHDERGTISVTPLGERLHLARFEPEVRAETIVARGREEPELLGWMSRNEGEMEPCTSVGLQVRGVTDHRFVSLLQFGANPPQIDDRKSRISRSGREFQIRWLDIDRWRTIRFERPKEGPCSVAATAQQVE